MLTIPPKSRGFEELPVDQPRRFLAAGFRFAFFGAAFFVAAFFVAFFAAFFGVFLLTGGSLARTLAERGASVTHHPLSGYA